MCNAQNAVYAGLSRADKISLVGARLYLPHEWTSDPKRCEKAGIPEQAQKYRTKPELGLEIVKELEGLIEYDWVGGDSVYGNPAELRKALREIGKAFVMDVSEQLQVSVEKPFPFLPESRKGRGRNKSRLVIEVEKISLKKLLNQIEASQWKTIEYREGTKGLLVREAVIKRVWIWKKGTAEIEETQVLISRKPDKTEVKYSLCDEPKDELSVETALFRQMQRYWIERAFQEIKEQIGLHQYQVRGWKAWHHHIATGDDGVAFHFGNANRECRNLAVNVVRGCEINVGKHLEKQAG